MFPLWSRSTEQILLDLQRAKQHELDEHDAAVQRIVDQANDPPAWSFTCRPPEPMPVAHRKCPGFTYGGQRCACECHTAAEQR